MKPIVLLIDDDEEIRTQMKWALSDDYDVILAADRLTALEGFKEKRPEVVLLDLGLPPKPANTDEGFATLSTLLALDGLVKIIIITGQTEREHAIRAIGQGAYEFICKPIQTEELAIILKQAFHVASLEHEYRAIQQQMLSETFEGMLGTSPKMHEAFSSIRKVATTDAPVLILGESGTGKEMAALAIHQQGARKGGPFVAINCGAIPENLLESELFGHEKGAFTGAHAQRQGRIELAAGGTLFLDEIGELPLSLQVKLLRFLQEKSIERVGGRKLIPIDTRVIAATNTDIKKSLAAGNFREDLYYRLAVVVIHLPPLRERDKDVLVLANAFLHRFANENSKKTLMFNSQALRILEQYTWPGNVRELENRVKRAVIMAENCGITPADLELGDSAIQAGITSLKEARQELERDLVQKALQKHNGRISRAAVELAVSRPTLYELMEKLGIKRD